MRDVVLVGGGHAHVQILRRWAMDPPPDVRLMVVLDRGVAVYSGMVPGFVAGDYARHELEIDVLPLARRAGAGVILAPALDLDPVRNEIALEGRPPIRFDLASLDVGSKVRGLELPGVREHALATRPIGDFVRRVDERVEALRGLGRPARILVVGGGAAGCELAFTLRARLESAGLSPNVRILAESGGLLQETAPRVRRAIEREAAAAGIEVLGGLHVVRVESTGAVVDSTEGPGPHGSGRRIEADLVVWATGAAPSPFPRDAGTSRLARHETGFLAVRDTLQAMGFDHVFAAGDCARLVDHAWMPRAGVYAVRQGPVLDRNLRAWLSGRPLARYRPQRDFLALLHLGSGRALGAKWGWAASGRAVLRLKDRIDRQFMGRFQVLDADGRPRAELARLGAMDGDDEAEEMACGGCAAKLGALPLDAALSRLPAAAADASVVLGLEARDDVAATRDPTGHTTLHNVDVIRAFCDDPWLIGRVAAGNALSDLQAKGGRPRHAQAVIALPELPAEKGEELLYQVLAGIRATLDPAGVSLLGGHTTLGDALSVGLTVHGDGPDEQRLLRQDAARAGDALLLAAPLGTGVVLAADMRGLARSDWVVAALETMQRTNGRAGELARTHGVHAATDVTGFGLAGHLLTLLRSGDLQARIDRSAIPLLPGARLLWQQGLRSTADPANRQAFGQRIRGAREADEAWLFDPQTAGGLLMTLAPEDVESLQAAFEAAGEPRPTRIGGLVPGPPGGGGEIEVVGRERDAPPV